MKRAFVRVSVVGPARLSLDVNWYDIETSEQNGITLSYEDSVGLTGDQLYSAINSFIASELDILSENILWT